MSLVWWFLGLLKALVLCGNCRIIGMKFVIYSLGLIFGSHIFHKGNMVVDLLAKEGALGRNVRFIRSCSFLVDNRFNV